MSKARVHTQAKSCEKFSEIESRKYNKTLHNKQHVGI